MNVELPIKPLARTHRRYTFLLLLLSFVVAIPLLYLYATGYRFDLKGTTNFISTGGIFISAERTGAEIYIDNELVRETRVFRRAFYAQNLDPGTHRVHVQREGGHTWVKELPVYPHLVTEAQAFNLPLIPEARVISPWQTRSGSLVIFDTYTVRATTTQELFIATTTATTTYAKIEEYVSWFETFNPVLATTTKSTDVGRTREVMLGLRTFATTTATSTEPLATTTLELNGVRLYEDGGDVYAAWVGPREEMPYYYCAEDFPSLGTSTLPAVQKGVSGLEANTLFAAEDGISEIEVDVQEVLPDQECKPKIRIDRKWQEVRHFDFFPGSTDWVIMVLSDGIYLVEIDDRGWQNTQPIMLGEKLDMRISNGNIYVYDGFLIYEMIFE